MRFPHGQIITDRNAMGNQSRDGGARSRFVLRGLPQRALFAQTPMPSKCRAWAEVHDDPLFIIVHQVYELWFKQIICMNSRRCWMIFSSRGSQRTRRSVHCVFHLASQRINEIQRLFSSPILEIMETMSPVDFLEFRDLLDPRQRFSERAVSHKLKS